ncbi:probable ubiquitin-like-specific protease 2A isoform X3 [Citrus sinensis]|uniref:probable ubiquitin-like-specific protease 2A isoform X3 n=1 Tax=Citrus sinensis TaxID=2711 RepID=UPI002278E762|nr:probable ubiquitin-like-specific protease 2A isoform X3 [Citrus sinensis]
MSPLSSKKKYKVFEFSEEDELVEKTAKKMLGKYSNPSKNQRHSSPIDKYKFLQFFSQGTKPQQKKIISEIVDVDAGVTQGAEFEDVGISQEPIGIDDGDAMSIQREDGAFREVALLDNFSLSSSKNYGNEQVGLISDSDDDDCMEMSSPATSSSPLSVNGVLLEEQVAECGSCGHQSDMENKMVVVFPDFIVHGDNNYTESRVTFSCSFVTVESSVINGTKGTFSFEWAIGDVINIQTGWCGSVGTAIVALILKSKDSTGVRNQNEIPGSDLLRFSVCDQHWPERLNKIISLDVRYKERWNTVDFDSKYEENSLLSQKSRLPSKCCSIEFDEPFEDVVYPKDDPDAVLISERDVKLLEPDTFINDTIIDFYIKIDSYTTESHARYLNNKIQTDRQQDFHFFNSFFFRKLADLDKDPSSACEGRAAFQRVRKWTRKVNLFEKDYIFIPVNYSLHWSLIVICHPGEVPYFRDDEIEKSLKVPCILHMDSIKGSHRGLKNLIQGYLSEEWKERHSNTDDEVPSKFLRLQFVPLELNRNWFPPAEVSMKRAQIKKLLYEISKDHSRGKDPSADSVDEHPSSQPTNDKIGKETGAVILGQMWNPTLPGQQGFSSISDAEKGIQISISGASPQRDAQYTRDPEFSFKEQCKLGTGPASLSDLRYQHVTSRLRRSIMSPIEEAKETDEQMATSPYNVENFKQVTRLARKYCGVPPKIWCDKQFSPDFDILDEDESMKECRTSLEVEVKDQPLAEYEGSDYLETTGKTDSFSNSSEGLSDFVVEDSQETSGIAAGIVEDSEEENAKLDGKENKDSPCFKGETCNLSHEVLLSETIYLQENIMLISNEVTMSKADEQLVVKKSRPLPKDRKQLKELNGGLPKELIP